jgi:transposase
VFANPILECTLVVMRRGDLTDEQWARLGPLLPPHKPRTGRPNEDHRRIVNGLIWINRLKRYRRVATRYEERAENYRAMLMIAAIML